MRQSPAVDHGPRPLNEPFRPAGMPAWCSPAWTSARDAWSQYWTVEPATRWEVTDAATCRQSPSWEGREVTLHPGTTLELTAIWACTDPNGACTWQTAESAHLFRVTSGPHTGATVELWHFANQVKRGVRPVDPNATVSFTLPFERQALTMPRQEP